MARPLFQVWKVDKAYDPYLLEKFGGARPFEDAKAICYLLNDSVKLLNSERINKGFVIYFVLEQGHFPLPAYISEL